MLLLFTFDLQTHIKLLRRVNHYKYERCPIFYMRFSQRDYPSIWSQKYTKAKPAGSYKDRKQVNFKDAECMKTRKFSYIFNTIPSTFPTFLKISSIFFQITKIFVNESFFSLCRYYIFIALGNFLLSADY